MSQGYVRRSVVISFLALWTTCPAAFAAEEARKELERLARALKLFATDDFLYDRVDLRQLPPVERQAYQQHLTKLTTANYAVATLHPLLDHPNPKVRTLALAALFAKDDPKLLPALAALANDTGKTFPAPVPFAAPAGFLRGPLPMREQTVGEVATAFVNLYLRGAGYYYGVQGTGKEAGFDAYWALRRDRAFCASWFAVQLSRAEQGTHPTPPGRLARIRSVRRRIDRLPPPDRAWTLLWLNGENGGDVLVTEEELLKACQALGPDLLVQMLRQKPPSNDPDLRPRNNNNGPYKGMAWFVLRHARALLRPGDAEALLACERWERDYQNHGVTDPNITPFWATAAAELQPQQAKAILYAALGRFQGKYAFDADHRAELAAALWRHAGRPETAFLVNWFYEENPQRGQFPHCRAKFLRDVAKLRPPDNRQLLAALLHDPRFATLDWQSLKEMIQVVNTWLDKPVIDPESLRACSHPFGEGHFHWQQDEAKKQYPKETGELLTTLSQWRVALRDSIPQWSR